MSSSGLTSVIISDNEINSLQRMHDRILMTPREDFIQVANSLIPKLLKMLSSNPSYLPYVIPIFESCKDTINHLDCSLDLNSLLKLLFDNIDLSNNFIIEFIDISLRSNERFVIAKGNPIDLTNILNCFNFFPLYTMESNSLAIYVLMNLELIPSIDKFDTILTNLKLNVGEFILDLSLIQSTVVRDSIGSVQPGLSNDKVNRITCKQSSIPIEAIVRWKYRIIDVFDSLISKRNFSIVSEKYLVLVLALLMNDPNEGISLIAKNKSNCLRELLEVFTSVDSSLPQRIMEGVCELVLGGKERSKLRLHSQISILNWLHREFSKYFVLCHELVSSLCFSLLSNSSSTLFYETNLLKLRCITLTNLTVVANILSIEDMRIFSDKYISAIKFTLQCFVGNMCSSITSVSLDSSDNSIGVSIRQLCYEGILVVAKKLPALIQNDLEIVMTLFRMLDFEDADTGSIIHHCLNVIKEMHVSNSANLGIVYIHVV